jgi:hypothetical protein
LGPNRSGKETTENRSEKSPKIPAKSSYPLIFFLGKKPIRNLAKQIIAKNTETGFLK